MNRGLEHVGLSVANLDRSVEFYRDVLGFKVERILEPAPELPLGDVVGMSGCRARIAHLQSAKGMLELFEYQEPRGKKIPKDHKQADNGFIHIGFTSSDARAEYRELQQKGVRFLGKPVEFRPGVWIFYFFGPDGEVCEMRQT
jgi:catechol 2,3-dioxygenase-like lactoylglutathione lyase family enzyme